MTRHANTHVTALFVMSASLLLSAHGTAAGDAESTSSLSMSDSGLTVSRMRVSPGGKPMTDTPMAETDLACLEALYVMPIRFRQTVFTGEKFPQVDCELTSSAAELIGRYTVVPRFFDTKYGEITTPTVDGRYGAVVEVRSENGLLHRRFVTLCRTSRPVLWRDLDLRLGPGSAQALGIKPEVVDAHRRDIEETIRWEMRDAMAGSPRAGVLMARLLETQQSRSKTDAGSADRVDAKWWLGLKKKLGFLEHRYLELLPEAYERDPARKFPLILFLHGIGERGLDLDLVRVHGPHKFLKDHPELQFIVIAPQCRPGEWWSPAEVLDLLDTVCAAYRVDPRRVYLTGLSMGGYGTWNTIPEASQRFAAAVPICGAGNPKDAPKLIGTPLWVFHGAKDTVVPADESREMVRAVRRAGGSAKFTLYPDAQHDSWTKTYADPKLYAWLLEHQRKQQRERK